MIDEKRLIEELRKYADELGTVRGEIELANGVLKAISIINEQPKVEEQKIDEKELIKRLENRTDGYRDELAKAETKEHKNFLSTVIGTLIDVTNMVRYWPKGDDES